MSTVTTLTKTPAGVLLALTQQATAVITIGSAVDVSTKMGAQILVKMGRIIGTPLTNEIKFRLESSAKASGNDEWFPYYQWTSSVGKTACNQTTLNGATTAGNTTTLLGSGIGFNAGAYCYIRETGTPANGEWSRVLSLSTNTVTWEEAQTRSHTGVTSAATGAESFVFDIDCSSIVRLRLVVDTASAASGQTIDVIGWINTLDSALTV